MTLFEVYVLGSFCPYPSVYLCYFTLLSNRAVAGEVELLVPVIREACATAGESVRVCNVFTQWSRQLGEHIRIEGLTGTQLLSAVEELKEDFYRNRMEDHWLLPSISPLLSLTAQELEKSRENSSIADTHVADESSRFPENDNLQKEEKNQSEEADSSKVDADRRGSDESVEKLLAEADAKSIQLQKQLEDLQRKISRSMNVKESVREQLAEVLDRLNSSVSLIEKGGVRSNEKEPEHKQSTGSVLSFEVTGGDIEHARKTSTSEELAVTAANGTEEGKLNPKDAEVKSASDDFERQTVEHPWTDVDENRTESRLSFGMDMDDELYQLYCDTSRLLGRPCKTLADCNNAETVVVNKGLLLEVIDCARILLTDKSGEVGDTDDQTLKNGTKEHEQEGNELQNPNEEEEDVQHEKGEEGAGLSIQKEGENEEKEDENEEVLPDDEGEKEKTTEEAERDEKSDPKTGPDEDEPVAQVKRLGADQAVNPADQPTSEQQAPDEPAPQEKSPTDEVNPEAEDQAPNEEISSRDGKSDEASFGQELPESSRQPQDLPSPSNEAGKDEAEQELAQTDDAETEFTDDGHEVNSTLEEETETTENRIKRNSAAASQSKGEDPSRATVMKTLPPYEFAHKYHIQSHLNTATTTSVVQQPVD
ncbi:hypothetical protein Q1695_011039 [Nippostrongylus brasiliensis]|nr:hypothetical protein Q1695_011039 [Nippostrongylus brasiliensis]